MAKLGNSIRGTIGVLVLALTTVATALLLTGVMLKSFFGIGVMRRAVDGETEGRKDRQRPLGVMHVVDTASTNQPVTPDSVPISAYNDIYASVGVRGSDFADWRQEHGAQSLGTSPDGSLLAPSYPVFSKIAWMYIDPVTLTSTETKALIAECERAIPHATSEPAKQELRDIRALAAMASEKGAGVRFGPP